MLFYTFYSDGNGRRKWIIFDGPVDTLWIESMNTVLDDNKVLCLSSGERLNVSSDVHMVFEVLDLDQASPATVSRCGMVYMEQVHVGLNALISTWNDKRRQKYSFIPQPVVTHEPIALTSPTTEEEEDSSTKGNNENGEDSNSDSDSESDQEENDNSDEDEDDEDDEKEDTNLEDTEGVAEEEQKVEVEMTVESESEAERRSFCNESMDRLVSVLKRQLEPILLFVKKKCKMNWPISDYQGKYSKRCRSNVAVIIVRIVFY